MRQITEAAQKAREQMLANVRPGQQLTVDAAKLWVDVLSVTAAPDLSKLPSRPGFSKSRGSGDLPAGRGS